MQGIEADDGEEQEREPGDGDFTFFAVSSGGGVPPRQDDACLLYTSNMAEIKATRLPPGMERKRAAWKAGSGRVRK